MANKLLAKLCLPKIQVGSSTKASTGSMLSFKVTSVAQQPKIRSMKFMRKLKRSKTKILTTIGIKNNQLSQYRRMMGQAML